MAEQGEETSLLSGCRALMRAITKVVTLIMIMMLMIMMIVMIGCCTTKKLDKSHHLTSPYPHYSAAYIRPIWTIRIRPYRYEDITKEKTNYCGHCPNHIRATRMNFVGKFFEGHKMYSRQKIRDIACLERKSNLACIRSLPNWKLS